MSSVYGPFSYLLPGPKIQDNQALEKHPRYDDTTSHVVVNGTKKKWNTYYFCNDLQPLVKFVHEHTSRSWGSCFKSDRHLKFYMDVEVKGCDFSDEDEIYKQCCVLSDEVVKCIRATMKEMFEKGKLTVEYVSKDVPECDRVDDFCQKLQFFFSPKKEKLSIHIHSEDHVFTDGEALKKLVKDTVAYAKKNATSYTTLVYMVGSKQTIAIDTSVYRSGKARQSLRFPTCVPPTEDKRPLVYIPVTWDFPTSATPIWPAISDDMKPLNTRSVPLCAGDLFVFSRYFEIGCPAIIPKSFSLYAMKNLKRPRVEEVEEVEEMTTAHQEIVNSFLNQVKTSNTVWPGYKDAYFVQIQNFSGSGVKTCYRFNYTDRNQRCPSGLTHGSQGFYCYIDQEGTPVLKCYSARCQKQPLVRSVVEQEDIIMGNGEEQQQEQPRARVDHKGLVTFWQSKKRKLPSTDNNTWNKILDCIGNLLISLNFYIYQGNVWKKQGFMTFKKVEALEQWILKDFCDTIPPNIGMRTFLTVEKSKTIKIIQDLSEGSIYKRTLKGVAFIWVFKNGIYCPLVANWEDAFIPFPSVVDSYFEQEVCRKTGISEAGNRIPCKVFDVEFDPRYIEQADEFAAIYATGDLHKQRDRFFEAHPITETIVKWTDCLRQHSYETWEDIAFVMAILFGRLQFPISHYLGDSFDFEVWIKGPSGSGKTSLVCPVEVWFEKPARCDFQSTSGKSRIDFYLSPFGRKKPDDLVFVYWRDVQRTTMWKKEDLTFMIETGPRDEKPEIIYRTLLTDDTNVRSHPWWWRILVVGVDYMDCHLGEDRKTLDYQVERRFKTINTKKIFQGDSSSDMKKEFGPQVIIPLMVLSARIYRQWCALARAGVRVDSITPESFKTKHIIKDKSPLQDWIQESSEFYNEYVNLPASASNTESDLYPKYTELETRLKEIEQKAKSGEFLLIEKEGEVIEAGQFINHYRRREDEDGKPCTVGTKEADITRLFSALPNNKVYTSLVQAPKEYQKKLRRTSIQDGYYPEVEKRHCRPDRTVVTNLKLVFNPFIFFREERSLKSLDDFSELTGI